MEAPVLEKNGTPIWVKCAYAQEVLVRLDHEDASTSSQIVCPPGRLVRLSRVLKINSEYMFTLD